MANENISFSHSPAECDEDCPNKENMLEILPTEIIKHFLTYTDEYSRACAALVCRKFYDIICDLERDKQPLYLRYREVSGNIFLYLLFR